LVRPGLVVKMLIRSTLEENLLNLVQTQAAVRLQIVQIVIEVVLIVMTVVVIVEVAVKIVVVAVKIVVVGVVLMIEVVVVQVNQIVEGVVLRVAVAVAVATKHGDDLDPGQNLEIERDAVRVHPTVPQRSNLM